MKTISINKVSFNKLIDCFIRRSENKFVLAPAVGKGVVQSFVLEKGLQAMFWDCSFNEELILDGYSGCLIENTYFTLAFFPSLDGLTFDYGNLFLKENIIWDSVFISTESNFKIHIAPGTRVHCLSISFSRRWLNRNLLMNNAELEALTKKINSTDALLLLQSMTATDKKFIEEVFDASWKKMLGSFFIKSAVLKIVWDFFLKLNQEHCNAQTPCISTAVAQIEKYFSNHPTGQLPVLKDLARKFSLSESTLKRHFKSRYGVNMSTYFNRKKMEYAHHLIYENKITISEAACMLGYRNVNNFMNKYKRWLHASTQRSL